MPSGRELGASSDATSKAGSFYAQAADVVGRNPEEIRLLLSLQQTPTYIQRVTLPTGSVLREGKIGPQLKFNNSPVSPGNTVSPGNVQYQAPIRQATKRGDLIPLPSGAPVR